MNFLKKLICRYPEPDQKEIQASTDKVLGRIDNFAKLLNDVKKYQKEVEDSKKIWEATFNAVSNCIAIVNSEGKITNFNNAFGEVAAPKSREQIIGNTLCDTFCNGSTSCPNLLNKEVCVTGCEKKAIRIKDRIFDIQVSKIHDEDGTVTGCVFVAHDITDYMKLMKDLNLTKLRYEIYFDNSPYGLYIVEPGSTKIIEVNKQACNQLEYAYEELKDMTMGELDSQETQAATKRLKNNIQLILSAGEMTFDTVMITKNKHLKNMRITAKPIRIYNSHYVIYCTVKDVTRYHPVSSLLSKEVDVYVGSFDMAFDPVVVVKRCDKCDGSIIVDANNKFMEMYGYKREDMIGKNVIDVFVAEPWDMLSKYTIAENVEVPLRWHKKKNGEVFPVKISLSVSEIRGMYIYVAFIKDLTEELKEKGEYDTEYNNLLKRIAEKNGE